MLWLWCLGWLVSVVVLVVLGWGVVVGVFVGFWVCFLLWVGKITFKSKFVFYQGSMLVLLEKWFYSVVG